jgi:hypothetical protein
MRCSLVSRSAGRILTTPSGSPASVNRSANSIMLREFSGDTSNTTVSPASRAGTSFAVAAENGEFQGITAATTPIASTKGFPLRWRGSGRRNLSVAPVRMWIWKPDRRQAAARRPPCR